MTAAGWRAGAEPGTLDPDGFADLTTFARIEVESGDVEPWAALICRLHDQGDLDLVHALWLVKLYNAYDSLDSAFSVLERWPTPTRWATADDRHRAADFPCTQERRNLRGGRVIHHLESYVSALGGMQQWPWLRQALVEDRVTSFDRLTQLTRGVWGVGRQTAFEWAEFVGKLTWMAEAGDAQLWESEGPRRSLQRLYGNPTPTQADLDWMAVDCRARLQQEGVALKWWDFETVICDFNVMRDGRYYPGRHLAAVAEEIEAAPARWRLPLAEAWAHIVPPAWQGIAPGIDKAKKPVYRETGRIIDTP